jgi:hypothetical protein
LDLATRLSDTMGRQAYFRIPRWRQICQFDPDNMAGGNFRKGDFRGFDLRGVDLRRACFEGADLTGAKLRGANLESANLRFARLENADLTDANLRWAELRETNFWHAKTKHTDMRQARNLACLTGTAYNAKIHLPQLRRAITDMNYPVWQKIWRAHRCILWSLVAVALAVGGRSARLLAPPWDHWATVASLVPIGLSVAGLLLAHYQRRFKTPCCHS